MKLYSKVWIAVLAMVIAALAAYGTLSAPLARAAGPWYVAPAPTGDDTNDCLSDTTPCATINGALAKPGFVISDTVLVATGTYTGSGDEVVLLDKDATLSGGWDANFTTQNGMSTIDGEGIRRGIEVNNFVTALIERFVIQNGNALGSGGGGILNQGTLTLNNSAIDDNTATTSGGGILNLGTLTLNNSVIDNNIAGDGGGIANGHIGTGLPISMTLNNSTISNNMASSRGGGIGNGGSATLNLNNSTVSGNSATFFPGSGGIYNNFGGTVTLQNSIIAGNIHGGNSDCAGTIDSLGYNLIGDTAGCSFTPTTGDLTNIDPKLDPLEGSPGYHPLLIGSPAIHGGNPAGCMGSTGLLTTDQRGFPRFGICDIGAYEIQPIHFSTKTVNPSTAPSGDPVTYTITLDNGGATNLTNVQLTDTLPISLTYINNSLTATSGSYSFNSGAISWNGDVNAGSSVTINFGATVSETTSVSVTITNSAIISGGGEIITRTATVDVASPDPETSSVYLPIMLKN